MSRHSPPRRLLRRARRMIAAAIARLVLILPAIEPAVVRAGRAGSRSRLVSGLYWFVQESLLARLRRTGERYRGVLVMGRRLQLDITAPSGRQPYFYGTPYRPGVTDAIVTALGPGDAFVDVGANVGYFTVLAAAIVGDRGRVIAFEPDATRRDALDEAVHRNVASSRVEIVGTTPDGDTGTTLDGWLRARPDLSHRIRCVKIETDGADLRVLAGMSETLRGRHLSIVCQTTLGGAVDRILTSAGYQWCRIEPGSSTSGSFLYLRP